MLKSMSFCLLILTLAVPALADEVHLANGRTMTGLITEETPHGITLDVGVGYVKLPHEEVFFIEKSDLNEAETLQSKERSILWDEFYGNIKVKRLNPYLCARPCPCKNGRVA